MSEFWKSVSVVPPYDTNLLFRREDGNVQQGVWYDETWGEFIRTSWLGVVGKRCGGIVAWAEIPPFHGSHSKEQGDAS